MAFSEYKDIGQVQIEFNITLDEENFIFANAVNPPEIFLREFEFTRENFPVFTSEGARTEAVIFPILREIYKDYSDKFVLWIQKSFSYDAKLNGTPDYLVATKSPLGKTVFAKPLLGVVEAKKNDFEVGWAQCLAELIAIQKVNADEETPVYGIVTDGERWQFGKFQRNLLTRQIAGFTIDDLPALFGALHFIFQSISKNVN
ncbi:MAG: hypothetical protein LH472_07175 [Pyrinomonadaceae bacterium]|nr:hypothetical protein [Pyrinomonadaceae bacterium]